ncbi:MAG: HEAT repeat domain-containing protein [Pirellulales bacterium]
MGRFLSVSVLSWSATACGLAAILGCAKPQPPAKPAAAPAAESRSTPPAVADAKPTAVVTPAAEPQPAADVAALAKRLADAATAESRVELIDQIAALGQQGKEAMPQLLAVLADADPRPRWRAARALGLIGEDSISAVPALVKLLADADPIVVTQAAAAIGMVKADDGRTNTPPQDAAIYAAAVEPLMKTTTHADPRARRAAMNALQRLVPDPARLAPLFCDQLADSEPSVVLPALHTLADMDAAAVPFLLEALKEPKSRYWATVAIAEIGPEAAAAVEPLAQLAADGELDERMQAALALAAIGQPAAAAVPALVKSLECNEELLRNAAAFALGKIGSSAADAPLEKAAGDPNELLSAIAAWGRAQLHPQDAVLVADAVQRMRKGLDSDNPGVRKAAVSGLSDLAGLADETVRGELVGEFVGLLHDTDAGVGTSAGAALVRLKDVAVDAVRATLADAGTRLKALEVLAAIGPAAKAAVPEITTLLTDADPLVRSEAAVALASVGPEAAVAVPALEKLLGDDAPADARYATAYALGRIGAAAKPAVPRLLELSKSSDEILATVASWAALKIEPQDGALVEAAIPLLRKALRGQNEMARLEAAVALGDIGPAASSAIPILELVSEEDSSRQVRAAATEALAKVRPRE